MPAIARTTDTISHGGIITGGSPTTKADGKAIARIGDNAQCSIHGAQIISSGSSTVKADNKFVARIGDNISCGATITSGSPSVSAN